MPDRHLAKPARFLSAAAAACACATLLSGCATERLVAAAPQGVDLSGEWRLNTNLSDDPGRLDELKTLPQRNAPPGRNPGGFGKPGATRPGVPMGPGGLDPGGGGENLTDDTTRLGSGVTPVLYEQSTDLPASASDSSSPAPPGPKSDRQGGTTRLLDAPELMTIAQSGAKVVMKSLSDGTTEEYTAGEQRTIPFGQTEADRTSGWRETAFVVITKARKGPSKEDDFALDSEGHLIFATLVTHVKKGPIDFKRVYDRVPGGPMGQPGGPAGQRAPN
jgi:hypothetical protein